MSASAAEFGSVLNILNIVFVVGSIVEVVFQYRSSLIRFFKSEAWRQIVMWSVIGGLSAVILVADSFFLYGKIHADPVTLLGVNVATVAAGFAVYAVLVQLESIQHTLGNDRSAEMLDELVMIRQSLERKEATPRRVEENTEDN